MQPNSPVNINSPMQNPFKSFVHQMDTYQHKKNLSLNDCLQLFDASQNHYKKNYLQYYRSLDTKTSDTDFYSFYNKANPYLSWQNQHEILQFNPIGELKLDIKEKTYCQIDFPLHTISDMLEMLNKYPYADDTKYNIDLKALHNIRPELESLNNMVGNKPLKRSTLRQLLYFIQHFDDSKDDYKHMIITGPPGTGKTEIAKIIGRMYSKLGILKKTYFKKITRADLVAGYLGQTAIKTKKVIDDAIGGVLFFDEAYSFSVDESYSKECIDTLCECLSDNRNNLMMIIAGYENELENSFFKINAGLKSRFIWKFDIEPYTIEELMNIFVKIVNDSKWKCSDDVDIKWFSDKKDQFKYNGRDMELLFSYVKVSHAQRIFGKDPSLKKSITIEDMNDGFKIFKENKENKDTENKENLLSLYI
jgi:SpoVK/Ycf46/Vps4 family AAA+-type ATPase